MTKRRGKGKGDNGERRKAPKEGEPVGGPFKKVEELKKRKKPRESGGRSFRRRRPD